MSDKYPSAKRRSIVTVYRACSNNGQWELEEDEARKMLKALQEALGEDNPDHVKVEGEGQVKGYKFCLLSYCSVRNRWARSCSNFLKAVATGAQVRPDRMCPKCGLQTVIKVHDLKDNRLILQ